jgi:hypothetical protein
MFGHTRRELSLVLAITLLLTTATIDSLTANAADAPPVWKVLWLNYSETDVTIERGGSSRRYTVSQSDADKNIIASMPDKFTSYIERSADNNVHIAVDYVCPSDPIKSVTKLSADNYWVSAADVKSDIDKYAPTGKYDSIIVSARIDGIPRNYWGMAQGMSELSNGAGYSFVAFLDGDADWYMTATSDNPYPEEVYVHEWLHQLESFYRDKGYEFPGIDEADTAAYGYIRANSIGYNGWHIFYADIMSGKVYNKVTKKYIGITSEMWHLTPTTSQPVTTPTTPAVPAEDTQDNPVADTNNPTSTDLDIPNNASVYGEHSYELYNLALSWKDAKEYCEKLGAHLATITSSSEQTFVANLAKQDGNRWYWIGATCEKKTGTWEWVTGEKWSYSNWESTEANNFGGDEFYANMDSSRNYQWNDLPNGGGYYEGDWLTNGGFVCEWDNVTKHIDITGVSLWAQVAVGKAATLGLTTADLTNDYQIATTRAEFCRAAVNLLRVYGYDVDGVMPKMFEDTSDRGIGIAAALGITSGTDTINNLFSPDSQLTREQAATMLRNVLIAIGKDVSAPTVAWSDAKDISSWASTAVDVMYAAKIMSGTNTTPLTFSPKTPYSHEQSIVTLVNLWEYVKK